MTKRILKYRVNSASKTELPIDSEIVKFAYQGGSPTVWVSTSDHLKTEFRKLRIEGTGLPVPVDWKYIETAFEGPQLVWHLFQEIK